MYSWEITKTMQDYDYNLPSNVYLAMTENSSQLVRITYNAWNDKLEMWDNEGGYWDFKVYYEAA